MAGVSPDLLWQLVKKNNKFLVKRNGNSSASVQFSSEPNNLFNLNTFKFSVLVDDIHIHSPFVPFNKFQRFVVKRTEGRRCLLV